MSSIFFPRDVFAKSELHHMGDLDNSPIGGCLADELEIQVQLLTARDADDAFGTDTDFSLPNSSYSHSSFSLFDAEVFTQQTNYLEELIFDELDQSYNSKFALPAVPYELARTNWLCVNSKGVPVEAGAWQGCTRSPWCSQAENHLGRCNSVATLPGLAAYSCTKERMNEVDASGSTLDLETAAQPGDDHESSRAGSAKLEATGNGGDEAENSSRWACTDALPTERPTANQGQVVEVGFPKRNLADGLRRSLSEDSIHQATGRPVVDRHWSARGPAARTFSLDESGLQWVQSKPFAHPISNTYPGATDVELLEAPEDSTAAGVNLRMSRPMPVPGASMPVPIRCSSGGSVDPSCPPGASSQGSPIWGDSSSRHMGTDVPRTGPSASSLKAARSMPNMSILGGGHEVSASKWFGMQRLSSGDLPGLGMEGLHAGMAENSRVSPRMLANRGGMATGREQLEMAKWGTGSLPGYCSMSGMGQRGKKRAAASVHGTCAKPAPNPNGHSCTQCGTQTTPVWRAGPHGPKTLCNACGVRYMKVAKKK